MGDVQFIVSILLAVILAVVPAFIVGRRSRQRPDLQFARDFDELIKPADALVKGGLRLEFQGVEIDGVCRTYIAIWNHRGDTVRRADLLESDPLRVVLAEGDSLLQARVVSFSRPQNALTVTVDPSAPHVATIDFAFLDRGDGGVIEILHREPIAPAVAGTIQGASLRARGSVSLDRETRSSIRASAFGRVFAVRGRRRALLWGWIALAITYASMGVTWLVRGVPRIISPAMVPVEPYDLTTIAGQAAFAAEVRTVGEIADLFWTIALMSVLLIGAAVTALMIYKALRSVVPRSVVQVDLDEEQEVTVDSPGRLFRLRVAHPSFSTSDTDAKSDRDS